jgi:two-component system, response regulator
VSQPVILLVEDSAVDEELTLLALRKAKIAHDVVVARDGAEALDYLFATGLHAGRGDELPKIVLLDLNLPKLGGVQVLHRIRSDPRMKALPVIILTSSKEDRDLADGYDGGANSYIVKPVDGTQFAEAVKQIGLYWLELNVPRR